MTTDFLTRIIARKKAEVAAAKSAMPEQRLIQKAAVGGKKRPFHARLEQAGVKGINVIAEIKRASPSKGAIRLDLDPAVYARAYEQGGACAISVLTDRVGFQGDPLDLIRARQATILPVLRKDFLISAYQLYESAAMGADAVLLIVRILEKQQLSDYLSLCRELGMDALVEVHSEADIQRASEAGAGLIGINNRNLDSFKTDVATAESLINRLGPHQIAVAESGIRDRKDILRLTRAGIHNFLIGETLVRAVHPALSLKNLMEGP